MNRDYIYKRRLLSLAKFLEKLPRERFDYESWVGDDWKGKEDLSCGTTACALGWATTIPSLRKAGLRLKSTKSQHGFVTMKDYHGRYWNAPAYATKNVFGLNNGEHEWLFVPGSSMWDEASQDYIYNLNSNASAKEVANHIRQFVKRKYK